MVVAIKLIGIFLGVLARSLSPYLRKLREGKIKSFQKRHLASSIGSLVLGIVITLLIFPQFQAPVPNGGLEVYVKCLCVVLISSSISRCFDEHKAQSVLYSLRFRLWLACDSF